MPAKGWKKKHGRTQQLAVRVEEETARRIIAHGSGSRADAMRLLVAEGLDALDRKAAGIDPAGGGKLQVELSPEERRLREQQRRFAEETMKRAAAEREAVDVLKQRILKGLERDGQVDYQQLLSLLGRGRRGSAEVRFVNRALRELVNAGKVVRTYQSSTPAGAVAMVAQPGSPAVRPPSPRTLRGAEDVRQTLGGRWRLKTREVREVLDGDDPLTARVLAHLLAEGELVRIAVGVYGWLLKPRSPVIRGEHSSATQPQ